MVGGVSNGENVGGSLIHLSPSVLFYVLVIVDVYCPIGVHRDHHFSNVRVDLCISQ